MKENNKVIVVDIDDTLTYTKLRTHILDKITEIDKEHPKELLKENPELKQHVKDQKNLLWKQFHEECIHDEPNIDLINELIDLQKQGYKIYAFSGRSDNVRSETVDYFKQYGLTFDMLKLRRDEQLIPSPILKGAWIKKYIDEKGDKMVCFIDDHEKTLARLTDKGYNTIDAKKGNQHIFEKIKSFIKSTLQPENTNNSELEPLSGRSKIKKSFGR